MDEERLRNLETNHALLEQRVEENIRTDEEFRRRVVEDLDCIKESNIRRDSSYDKYQEIIDNILEEKRAKAEVWIQFKSKLASAGVWAAIALMGSIIWYATKQFFHVGGN